MTSVETEWVTKRYLYTASQSCYGTITQAGFRSSYMITHFDSWKDLTSEPSPRTPKCVIHSDPSETLAGERCEGHRIERHDLNSVGRYLSPSHEPNALVWSCRRRSQCYGQKEQSACLRPDPQSLWDHESLWPGFLWVNQTAFARSVRALTSSIVLRKTTICAEPYASSQ